MNEPDLQESAMARAIDSTGKILASPWWGVTLACLVVIGGLSALLTTSSSTEAKIVAPIITGLIIVLLDLLATFIVRLVVAPYAQRNELRRNWPSEGIGDTVNVELALRNFSRQADDMAVGMGGSWDDHDANKAKAWADEVGNFLGAHNVEGSREFMDCAIGANSPISALNLRSEKLRELADRLH